MIYYAASDLLMKFMFAAHLYFPKEYPLRPPRMKFVTEMWHPNIDQNGDGESQQRHLKKPW